MRNVGLTFAYRISDAIATGIWSSAMLSTYISVLMGGNDAANEVTSALSARAISDLHHHCDHS